MPDDVNKKSGEEASPQDAEKSGLERELKEEKVKSDGQDAQHGSTDAEKQHEKQRDLITEPSAPKEPSRLDEIAKQPTDGSSGDNAAVK